MPQASAVALVQRLGVLVNLPALEAEVRRQGGELSFRRLLRGIGGDRPLVRALCLAGEGMAPSAANALASGGFEVQTAGSAAGTLVALAVEAMALAPRVDAIVIAPGSPELLPLVAALRSQGVRVETAGFDEPALAAAAHRRLGRDCVFVP